MKLFLSWLWPLWLWAGGSCGLVIGGVICILLGTRFPAFFHLTNLFADSICIILLVAPAILGMIIVIKLLERTHTHA